MQTIVRPNRAATPARWQAAVQRARKEGIEVRQLAGSGAWIATSGTQRGIAYELQITGNIAHDCECQAGQNGDPVCKHKAAFYLLIGALTPERPCVWCDGTGFVVDPDHQQPSLRCNCAAGRVAA